MKKNVIKFLYKFLLKKIFNPFLGLNIKPINLTIKQTDKCLVIAPHPDDESIGCGGILSLYPQNFKVICLTHEKNTIRNQEFQEAMQFAKIKNFKMFDLADKNILNGYKEFSQIDISNFDYIFIPYLFDQHKDHKAVSVLLNRLFKEKKYNETLKIAFYEVWSTINMPNFYLDISNVAENKKLMINAHKSQIKTKNYADKIAGLNSYRGLLKNTEYVESFAVLDVADFKNLVSELVENI